MNVLYISHETTLGGASIALLEVIDQMKYKNINIYVSVIDDKGSFYEELIKRDVQIIKSKYFTDMTYDKNIIKKIKGYFKSIVNIFSALKIARIVKKNKIDIIHTNTSVILIGALVSKLTGISHIFHIREFTEYKNRRYRLPSKYVNKFVNNNSKKIIVISKALYLHNIIKFSDEKIKLVYDGIDINKYFISKNKNKDGIIKILVTGSITENKGQEDVIKALDYLIKNGYKNIRILLAGYKNTDYYKYLIDIINKKNLNDYIKFLGYIEDIEKIRANIDIELNCSRSEGFGRVTIEAMLNEIPVIGSNNTATSELIKDGINGLLYESGNIHELAKKIIRLIENEEERREMGKNAREYVLENFSDKKNAEQIYDIYKDIIEGI